MNMKIFFSVIMLALAIVLIPHKASAQVMNFGGKVTVMIPCTCARSAGMMWVFMFPLYYNSQVPMAGAMVYYPSTILHANFVPPLAPAVNVIGKFVPTTALCWIGAEPYCAPLIDMGLMTEIGTSIPGV